LTLSAGKEPQSEKLREAEAARFRRRAFSRRLALLAIIPGLLAVVGATLALAPWLISPAMLGRTVAGRLQQASGLYVAVRGDSRIAFLPRPHIAVSTVTFADRANALVIEAAELHGVLKVAPLLLGRLDISGVALVRPRIRLDLDREIDAPGPLARAAAAGAATPEAQKADAARFGLVKIVDGDLTLRRGERTRRFEKLAVSLDWPKLGEPATLSGDFDWRGERLNGLLWIARPGLLLRHEQSLVTTRLDGEHLSFEAQGFAQTGAGARFLGRIVAKAASAPEALRLFDIEAPLPGAFRDAGLSANADITGKEAKFSDLRLEADGNAFAGTAALQRTTDRIGLRATLASAFVSLAPFLAETPSLVAPDGQWSRERFEPPDLTGADVDVRISAGRARLGQLAIDHGALALTIHDGQLDLTLEEAQAYRGRLRAQGAFRPTADGGVAARVSAQVSDVDAGTFLRDAFDRRALGGTLNATLALESAGASMDQSIRALNGRATLDLTGGEIAGVDFDRALRDLASRPLASARNIGSGVSAVAQAHAKLAINHGAGVLEEGTARGDGFGLALSGAVNFIDMSLAIRAEAQSTAGGGSAEAPPTIAFALEGDWDAPTWTADPRSFLKRSGAAAPLFPAP
jgi:AsmA protein